MMLNILEDYIYRSLPEWGDFSTNPNLTKKIDRTGAFLPFYGNTVVFDLSSGTKQVLQDTQEELYEAAGWMLAQKLNPSTFHMTLHDLVNGPEWNEELKLRMAAAEAQAKQILQQWKEQGPIRMKATWLTPVSFWDWNLRTKKRGIAWIRCTHRWNLWCLWAMP